MKITLAIICLLSTTAIGYAVEIVYAEKTEVVAGIDSRKLAIEHEKFFAARGFDHEAVSCKKIILFRDSVDSVAIAAFFEFSSVANRDGKKQLIPSTCWLWFNTDGSILDQAQPRALGNQIIPGNPYFSHSFEDKKQPNQQPQRQRP